MTYKVLGRRVLLKVKKFKKEDVKADLKYIEGSSLILAPEKDKLDDELDLKITGQTLGEIVAFGESAWLNDDGSRLAGKERPVEIGEKVHFQRYGAIRLNPKKHLDEEFWVVEDKDLFAVE